MLGARDDLEGGPPSKGKTRALVAEAAEPRDGPVRVKAPLLKRTEEGQGQGGGAQGQVRGATATEAPFSPGFPATLSG